ncbi:MAG: type IV pilus assembly protein PilM [Armatimonadetes bacterium]|nr:type IV pilus assembly protein PilM [Armatimonadota bacterium]
MGREYGKTRDACAGIDIGSSAIKAVELVWRADELFLHGADMVPTPPGAVVDGAIQDRAAIAGALRNLWRQGGFSSTQVIASIDLRHINMRWHHLEVEADDVLEDIVRHAAVRGITFPSHEAVTDYRVLSSKERRGRLINHVMVVAARESAVDTLMDTAERAGLEPVAVDPAPMAVTRAICGYKHKSALWSGQPEAHCVIGYDSTLVCITRGSALEFARSIPVGSNQFTLLLAKATGGDIARGEAAKTAAVARVETGGTLRTMDGSRTVEAPCEAVLDRLVREIGRSLRHFQSQFSEGSYLGMIGRVTLGGGGVVLRGLDTCLADRLNYDVKTVNPFSGLSVLSSRLSVDRLQNLAPAYAIAMGLALGHFVTAEDAVELEAA